ncbi:MAG: hypothetical protein NVS3B12_03360 [Acidimicrobiales bacterium]
MRDSGDRRESNDTSAGSDLLVHPPVAGDHAGRGYAPRPAGQHQEAGLVTVHTIGRKVWKVNTPLADELGRAFP